MKESWNEVIYLRPCGGAHGPTMATEFQTAGGLVRAPVTQVPSRPAPPLETAGAAGCRQCFHGHVISAQVLPGPLEPRHFSFRRIKMGPIDVIAVETSAHSIVCKPRWPHEESAHQPFYYQLQLLQDGKIRVWQGEREALVREGELVLLDLSQPFRVTHLAEDREAVIVFPHEYLQLPRTIMKQIVGTPIETTGGIAKVVGSFLGSATEELDQIPTSSGYRFLRSAIGMIEAMYTEVAEQLCGAEWDYHHSKLREIRAYIDCNLSDPGLCPAKVAAANHVSLRHLHNLFRLEEITVSDWIKNRRLEECRNDLSNPALASQPVASIAYRHGFIDSAHFSRLFRARFSETPTGFRVRSTQAERQELGARGGDGASGGGLAPER